VSHLSDDDLVLHYYGEDGSRMVAAEGHLHSCAQCARAYDALTRTLSAVTPPEFVEALDDLPALRQLMRDRSRASSSSSLGPVTQPGTGLSALVWLVPLMYPASLRALFSSAQWAQSQFIAIPFVALALMWACAGPFIAMFALNRLSVDGDERPATRVLVVGAVMAAITPSLFPFVSRVNESLSLSFGVMLWYCVISLGAVAALFRWPTASDSNGLFLYVHRLTALVLTVFVLAHVINQALAFISLSSYTAMRDVMRVASQQPASYALLVGSVGIQIATGTVMSMKRVRAGALARNLQTVSGWCLTAFLLVHVLSPVLFSRPLATTGASINPFDLLATPRSAAELPFLLLGVAAFLAHVGVYARLVALVYLAEASVRRLSYTAAFVGAMVVMTVGLSLCGIHLLR
jgi:succinate dehydrogenase/fumarate reductase cytochrome b subunit